MTHLHSIHSPPSPTPRQQEILERTLELVQESGLANLTLKKVAERVGFTEAAIYRHFASKRELIFGLIGILEQRLLTDVAAVAEDASLPPAQRVLNMVRRHLGIMHRTNGLPLLLVAEGLATGDQELVERLGRVMVRYRTLLATALEQIPDRPPVPAALHAILFLGLPAALGMLLRAIPQSKPSEDELEALLRFYVHALTSAPPPLPVAEPHR